MPVRFTVEILRNKKPPPWARCWPGLRPGRTPQLGSWLTTTTTRRLRCSKKSASARWGAARLQQP